MNIITNIILILILAFLLLITAVVNLFSGAVSVPSNRNTIKLMLEVANLKKGDVIYDLGCGDARLLIQAEKKYGTIGIGYENAPITFLVAQILKKIRKSNVKILFRNFFKDSLSEAKIIFLYLSPEVQKNLTTKIKKECRKGTTIISNCFHLPDLTPYKTIPKDKKNKTNTVHIYKIK